MTVLSRLDLNEKDLGMAMCTIPLADHSTMQFSTAELGQNFLGLIHMNGNSFLHDFRPSAAWPTMEYQFEVDVRYLSAGTCFVGLQTDAGQLSKKLMLMN